MNKTNQGIEVNLSVIAISAILVASLFVMGSSRFTPDAMAQTNETGGMMMNETGTSMNQTGGMMMNETGTSMNQTGGGGGAASQSAMVMIPKDNMTMVMASLQQAMTAMDSGNEDDAKMALASVQQELTGPAMAAGMSVENMPSTSSEQGGGDNSEEGGGGSSGDGGGGSTEDNDGG
jgi:hypothetical protein